MRARYSTTVSFSELTFRHALFLACLMGAFLSSRAFSADIPAQPTFSPAPTSANATSSLAAQEQHQNVGILVNYLRAQIISSIPALQHNAFQPSQWFLNGLHDAASSLGMANARGGQVDDALTPFEEPETDVTQMPSEKTNDATWISPGYHHKGFLPFHDAAELGFSLRRPFLGDALRFELHPYYGQNWVSERSYAGGQMSLLINRSLGFAQSGKISLNYVNGDPSLMDRSHGLDLHSEIQFTNNVALHAGVRQNESSEMGNYVLVEWKLLTN